MTIKYLFVAPEKWYWTNKFGCNGLKPRVLVVLTTRDQARENLLKVMGHSLIERIEYSFNGSAICVYSIGRFSAHGRATSNAAEARKTPRSSKRRPTI